MCIRQLQNPMLTCDAAIDEKIISSLEHVIEFQRNLDFNIVTSEAKLLYTIKRNPGKNVKYYMIESGLSSRWFHISLNKLLETGLVHKSTDAKDVRFKILF